MNTKSLCLPKNITVKKHNCSLFSRNFKVKFAAKLTDMQSVTLCFAKLPSCPTDLQVSNRLFLIALKLEPLRPYQKKASNAIVP